MTRPYFARPMGSVARVGVLSTVAMACLNLQGCADPCVDDGLGQDQCPAAGDGPGTDSVGTSTTTGVSSDAGSLSDSLSASTTRSSESASGTSTTASDTQTATASTTSSQTGSETGTDTSLTTTTGGSSGTGDLQLYCLDSDGDGFGDPDQCVMDDAPPDGHVPNADDCDDSDPDTFPGAAEEEDPNACMNDSDDDGWGDPDVPGGVVPGSDCHDENPGLNPGTNVMLAFETDEIWQVDPSNAVIDLFAPISLMGVGPWNVISATVRDDGVVFVTNAYQQRISTVDHSAWCQDGMTPAAVTEMPDRHDLSLCGLSFGPDGGLYGIDSGNDAVVVLDPVTGDVVASFPLVDEVEGTPIEVGACAMATDCIEDRLLFADGNDGDILSVDATNGESTILADTDESWSPNGMAYDPVTRTVFVAGNASLLQIELDGSNMVIEVGAFDMGGGGASLSDIGFMPGCG